VPIVKSSSGLSLAANAALVAYLRTLADRRAAELTALPPPSATLERWSVAPLARGRYQRVVPLREPRIERIAINSCGEPHVVRTRGAR
jgi:hypothetical protein